MIDDSERASGLEAAWQHHARAALQWRDGEPIAPVLDALALSAGLEAIGALGDVPRRAREDLLRVGRRALLHAAQAPPVSSGAASEGEGGDDEEELAEAHRIAVALARDGLRALAGSAPEEAARSTPVRRGRPTPREIARLVSGDVDPYEAATIARAVRVSPEARAELAWALRRARGHAEAPVRMLAAADGELMRDPASGRRIAVVCDPASGEVVVEVYVFAGAALAAYGVDDAALRVEAPGVRTEAMQPGYWAGAIEGAVVEGERELTIHVGDVSHVVRAALDRPG